jgi:predicted phage terminase large subunit-like protein
MATMLQTPLPVRANDLRALLNQIDRNIADDDLRRTRENADAIRYRCRTFAGFVREAWPILEPSTPLIWGWHLDAMCEHLEALATGRMTPRLIINVPPGSSKSLLASVFLHAWIWGPLAQPGKRFLGTSFRVDIATRDSRKARDLMMSEWYQTLWPTIFTRTGESNFANSNMGSRIAVAFPSLIGERGDILGVDDPHSLDGAESEVDRNKSVRRFIEGGQSRINDRVNSIIFIIMQRLHMEDLTGAVLARNLGYEHLMIPMRYEADRSIVTQIGWKDPRTFEGELMDPARVPEAEVQKEEQSEYSFAGQYQQRPAPREGGMFKVEKIEIVDIVPAGALTARGWDLAGSTRKTSAYTVGVRMSRKNGLIYIEDVIRVRKSPGDVETLIHETAQADGFSIVQDLPQDPAQAGLAQKLRFAELLAGYLVSITPEKGKKEDRALAFASQVDLGMVRLRRGPWNAAFIDELRNFPNGTFKDQVDAAARAFARILRGDGLQPLGGSQMIEGGDNAVL